MNHATQQFQPLRIAVLTISDTRTLADDKSGELLAEALEHGGHQLVARRIVADDRYLIRAVISEWIAGEDVQVIITTGGTGFRPRDVTPGAVRPLLDREIPGFGELFRSISVNEIGASTIQSCALAGITNRTLIFCLPGSTGACRTAWDQILKSQLDARHQPCNFAELLTAGHDHD